MRQLGVDWTAIKRVTSVLVILKSNQLQNMGRNRGLIKGALLQHVSLVFITNGFVLKLEKMYKKIGGISETKTNATSIRRKLEILFMN